MKEEQRKITKTYCMNLRAIYDDYNPDLEIYFDRADCIGLSLSRILFKVLSKPGNTKIYIAGIDRDKLLWEEDRFLLRDEVRELIYGFMEFKENLDFINDQHPDVDFIYYKKQ